MNWRKNFVLFLNNLLCVLFRRHAYQLRKTNRRPAAFLFVCAFLGALLGAEFGHSHKLFLASILTLCMIILIRYALLRIFLFLLLTSLLTATMAALERENYITKILAIPKQEAVFVGVVQTVGKREDGSIIAKVLASQADQPSRPSFIVRLRLTGALALKPPTSGNFIRFKGQIQPNSMPSSSIDFDHFRYGFAHHIHGRLTLSNTNAFHSGPKVSHSIFSLMRETIIANTQSALTTREASSLLALVIGDTNLLSEEQQELYRNLGAQHLLAVSGLQVTALAFLCFWFLVPLFGFMQISRMAHGAQSLAAFFTIIFCFCFVGLVGFPSSAVRAFIMATVLLLPNFFARAIDPLDSFYVSGLTTLLLSPEAVFDLGYLLSYAAVFGLLIAHGATIVVQQKLRQFSLLLAWLFTLILTSVAAFFATLPIILVHVGTFAKASILANIVLVPVATVLQIPAILLGLMGALFNGQAIIRYAAFFSNAIEIFAEALQGLFNASTTDFGLSTKTVVCVTLAFCALFLFLKGRRPIFLLMAGFLLLPLVLSHNEDLLKVTVLPVGQGDASLFSLPSGHHILVDAGGRLNSTFDPGEHIVVPTLKRRGINKLDVFIITHPDPDHLLGAFAIFRNISVKELWHSGFAPDHPLTKQLLQTANLSGVRVKNVKEILGSHQFGKTELQILAPDTGTNELYFSELSANDNSIVLRILHGQHQLLWPGDIEEFGEMLLLSSQKDLFATILKAPHHGSKTSSSLTFLASVNPQHVIYTTGENNRFGFPHSESVEKFRSLGAKEWNTATDGEITISITDSNMHIKGYRPSGVSG